MVSPQTGSYGPGEVRLAAIGEGFSEVQKNMGTWIVATLIYAIIGIVLNVLQRNLGPHVNADGTIGGSTVLGLLLSLVGTAIGAFISGGFFKMAFKQLRGEAISPGDIFSAGSVVPALLIASLLTGIAVFIGTLLCVIPGLIIGSLLMLTTPLIVDKNANAIEGMTQSVNALKPHIVGSLVFLLALVVVNLAGALLCGLGLLVTVPVSILAVAIVYRDFFLGGTSASESSLFPPLPNVPPRS